MRSVREMLGGRDERGREIPPPLGEPGESLPAFVGVSPGPGLGQVGAEALGSLTGAPPRTQFLSLMVVPAGAPGGPTLIVPAERQSRFAFLTAPFVGFSIFVGDAGVKTSDLALPPGLPYELLIPGLQDVYAVTDAPVFLPLKIQIGPLLIGDRERKFYGR